MKRCSRCGETKPLEAFSKRPRSKDGMHPWCRRCCYLNEDPEKRRARNARLRAADPEKFRRQSREQHAKATREKRAWADSLKAMRGCRVCGEMDPIVLDWHHVGTKTGVIGRLIADNASWARLDAEIANCDVLCANCHRREHRDQRGERHVGQRSTRSVR